MNRAQRRAEQARRRRTEAVKLALSYLVDVAPEASGATLFLPSGEVLYLDASTARDFQQSAPSDKAASQ